MNQADLINIVAENTGLSKKQTEAALKLLGDVISNALARGDEVTLPGLGKLSVKTRAARKGRNPGTGEEITIKAKNVPHFTAAKALKEAVNEPQH